MRTVLMSRPHTAVVAALALAGFGLAFAVGHPGTAAGQPAAAAQPAPAAPDERAADREAVQKALDGFSATFHKGDGKGMAALWTPAGEYFDDAGATYRGRAALEKSYAEYFAKHPENTLDIEVGSIRFPSRDTAVVEGYFKLHQGKKKDLTVTKCVLLYAREDGKWQITIAREQASDGLGVRDLEWLIGSWEAKKDGVAVTARYEWTANKSFIRCQMAVTQDGKTLNAMQMLGRDPAAGALRIWTFEDNGGIGLADITRDAKMWVFTSRVSMADGKVATATNLLTQLDADALLWHSVHRVLDGEPLPDLPPVRVTRVRAK